MLDQLHVRNIIFDVSILGNREIRSAFRSVRLSSRRTRSVGASAVPQACQKPTAPSDFRGSRPDQRFLFNLIAGSSKRLVEPVGSSGSMNLYGHERLLPLIELVRFVHGCAAEAAKIRQNKVR
jgi:hypothetical protein